MLDKENIRSQAAALTETVHQGPNVTPLKAVGPGLKFVFEYANDIEITGSQEWLVEDLLPRAGLAAIYGAPGCGKSFLALDVTGHIAAGLDWFGQEVKQSGVVYLAAEAGAGFRKRVAAWRKEHKVSGRIPFAMVPVAPNLGTTKEGGEAAKLIADIKAQAPSLGFDIGVIVIDTLARTLNGADENSSMDMGSFISNAGLIAEAFNCLVIAVHHSGKDSERGMRGSSALHGACDAEWEIREGEGGEKLVKLVKLKDGEDGIGWRFKLQQHVVFDPATMGQDGKPVTSCTIEETAEPNRAAGDKKPPRKPNPTNTVVLQAVKTALAERGELLPRLDAFPSGRGVRVGAIKDVLYPQGFGNADNPKSRDAVFNRALVNLAGLGLVHRHDEWVWLC